MALTPPAHVLSTIVIINRTTSILPIAAGVKLQPGQTVRWPLQYVQQTQEMMPRLKKLLAAGKVSFYKEVPGGVDIAGTPETLRVGSATVTGNVTRFILPSGAESATDTVGYVMPHACTLRNLFVRMGTAPGGTDTDAVTVMLNGVATALTCTITGTATAASDTTHSVEVLAGDKVSFRNVTSATASGANLMIAVEAA